jgi:alkanesulfonate monooxygenase SsuD/methylene tetrahydromethanopterin reductase-like flavin-dependent oxidoreductase (luciferase family)
MARTDLKFGWHMPAFPTDGSRRSVFIDQMATTLDRIQDSFSSAWADDHLHPWASFQAADTDALECMTTISYLAGAFPQLEFGSLVLCQSYRNPALLAKMAATLQLLTRGRFIFGIGAGWLEEEYLAYGYHFPRPAVRIAQLDEALQIVRKLWTETPATFEGTYYHIKDAYCEPKPDPVPPIMIGGQGEQLTLRVVAKHADWWNMPGGNADTIAHKLKVLRSHCEAVGRDYDEIVKSWSLELVAIAETEQEAQRLAETSPFNSPNAIVGTPAQVTEQLQVYVDLGLEYFMVRLADFPNTTGIELFAEAVVPQFG